MLRAVLTRVAQPAARAATLRAAPVARCFSAEVQTFLDKGEVTDRVVSVIKNFEKVDPAKVTPSAAFSDDLGLDSLDAVEVCMALEEEFVITIPDEEAEKIASVESAIHFIATHPQAK